MSLVPETDPNHQGEDEMEATSSLHHNIELPNGTSNATEEPEQYNDVKEKTNEIPLETISEIGNETFEHQVRMLEEKFSAALSNLNDKEEMVKQHEKVAVEAVAGWEKSLTEVSILKQELDAANEEKIVVENRAKQLDEALKECVKQLGEIREEQEQKIQEAVLRKTRVWDSIRSDLKSQLLQLQAIVESSKVDSDMSCKLQYLENEIASLSEELEVRTIERDLNAQAAETASKQHLDNIKKLAKLEAENRNLRFIIGKSSLMADHKSVSVSSLCVESLTDSQSDSGEQMNAADMNIVKIGINECEPSCSDSWTTSSFPELDCFKKQKAVNRNIANSATEIDLMDDFLEMEHFAALPANESQPSAAVSDQAIDETNSSSNKVEDFYQQRHELQEKLQRLEAEKNQLKNLLEKIRYENSELEEKLRNSEKLKNALADEVENLQEEKAEMDLTLTKQLKDYETALEALRTELNKANDSKQYYEQKAISTDVELKTMAAEVVLLQEEIAEERTQSKRLEAECRNLKDALLRQKHEVELELTARLNTQLKIKHEDLAVTALKLAECQRTLMSVGDQLQSLATFEDLAIDGKHSQLTDGGEFIPGPGGDVWKMHSNCAFLAKQEAGVSDVQAKESNDCDIGFTSSFKDHSNTENGEAEICSELCSECK